MIAIVPARGGSKGLPGKNLRPLCGLPLIAHTIRAALAAEKITRVVLSTDDKEIAQVGKAYGAEVPFIRPPELAGDSSMVMDAYLYTVDRLAKEANQPLESFVALLPTVPLRLPSDIDAAIQTFYDNNADSVISVTEAPVPLQWHRKIDEDGVLRAYLPSFDAVSNRQAFEEEYVPNGAIYIFKTEVLRATRQYYTDRTFPYLMPPARSADVDTLIDFQWAEFLLGRNQETNESSL